MLTFQGIHADILKDRTPEVCVLGARDSGKTTVCIYKEIKFLIDYPKLKSFLFRFSDKDTQSKLVPFVREMANDEFGCAVDWDGKESCFNFPNGSIAYMFGLQATTSSQRYSKMRGLGVGRVFAEQAEELPSDIGLELRAALRQPGFQHVYQLSYCANPPAERDWLCKQFPPDQRFKTRKLFLVSLYDNAHNLSKDTIAQLEQAFPPEHPKHRTIILGLPGVNVIGEPVYGSIFQAPEHVQELAYDPTQPLYEGFDFGKLNPCWIVGQRPYAGGWRWLGGILGQELFLQDFLPLVREHRDRWFGALTRKQVRTCCTLSASFAEGNQSLSIRKLNDEGFHPIWMEGSNSPDTVLSLIERQASYLHRDQILVNSDATRWLKASAESVDHSPFMAQAYGGGYSWSDKVVSVGRNEFKQPMSDNWFEYPMRAAEAIELNFGGISQQEKDERKAHRQAQSRASEMQAGQRFNYRNPNSWMA